MIKTITVRKKPLLLIRTHDKLRNIVDVVCVWREGVGS